MSFYGRLSDSQTRRSSAGASGALMVFLLGKTANTLLGVLALTGFAQKLQATARRGSLFRTELPLLVSDPEFLCKAALMVLLCAAEFAALYAFYHLRYRRRHP